MKTKLARSQTDKMLAGVCGGLAAYLGLEAIWVRLFFVLVTVVPNGFGVLLYIILWIIMPEAGREDLPADQRIQANAQDMAGRAQEFAKDVEQTVRALPNRQAGILIGGALIAFGIVFLLNNLNLVWWLRFDQWWPLLLVVGGVALLISRMRGE